MLEPRCLMAAALSLAGVFAAPSMGGSYYVSPSGSALNDGTQDSPWPSVTYALIKVGGGNTIILEPGTYAPFYVPRGYGGASSHPTVIESQDKWQAVIDGTLNLGLEAVASESNGPGGNTNYVTFDGLKIVHSGAIGLNLGGNWDEAINCWVTGSKLSGIGAFGYHNVTIQNNLIENNGTSTQLDHGIYAYGCGLVITGNIVRNNAAYGMQLWPNLQNSTVSGNIVYGQPVKGDVVFGGATATNTVTNNTFLDCASSALMFYGPNMIAAWSGNLVNPSVNASSLNSITSNNVADYAAALAAILPRSAAMPNQSPVGSVIDSGLWGVNQTVWVRYTSSQPLSLSGISPANVIINGPGGYSAAAQSIVYMVAQNNQTVEVVYALATPKGGWTSANTGNYTVSLQPAQISDSAGDYAAPGTMSGGFKITIAGVQSGLRGASAGTGSTGAGSTGTSTSASGKKVSTVRPRPGYFGSAANGASSNSASAPTTGDSADQTESTAETLDLLSNLFALSHKLTLRR